VFIKHGVSNGVNVPSVVHRFVSGHGFSRTATQAESAAEARAAKDPQIADSTIRVDVSLLDKLINLVGELVLARNQPLQDATVHLIFMPGFSTGARDTEAAARALTEMATQCKRW
jgi:chemotaxis protein histidine kinase CheA